MLLRALASGALGFMRVVVWLDVNFNQETLRTVLFELAILAMPGP